VVRGFAFTAIRAGLVFRFFDLGRDFRAKSVGGVFQVRGLLAQMSESV
jgi:hypothetical protein